MKFSLLSWELNNLTKVFYILMTFCICSESSGVVINVPLKNALGFSLRSQLFAETNIAVCKPNGTDWLIVRLIHQGVLCYLLFLVRFSCSNQAVQGETKTKTGSQPSWELVYQSLPWNNGLSWWLSGKEHACQCRRGGFNPWVRKILWRRKWQPTPVF